MRHDPTKGLLEALGLALGLQPVGGGVEVDGAVAGHDVGDADGESGVVHTHEGGHVHDIDGAVVFPYLRSILAAGVMPVAFAYVEAAVGVRLEDVVVGVGGSFADTDDHVDAGRHMPRAAEMSSGRRRGEVVWRRTTRSNSRPGSGRIQGRGG